MLLIQSMGHWLISGFEDEQMQMSSDVHDPVLDPAALNLSVSSSK
jgi:hypothetical protein